MKLEEKVGQKIGLEVRQALLMQAQYDTNGTFAKRILNDRILLEMKVIVAKKHNKLFDFLDRKMQQLFEGGVFDIITEKIQENVEKNRFLKNKEPFKVLTFDELEAGFVICFMPLVCTIFVFCLEWIVVLKDYVLIKSIFDAFFKIHQDELKAQSEMLDLKIAMWNKIVKERRKQAKILSVVSEDYPRKVIFLHQHS